MRYELLTGSTCVRLDALRSYEPALNRRSQPADWVSPRRVLRRKPA